MIPVYIAIGSNLADPLDQVNRAIAALDTIPQSRLVRHSAFYRTAPMGPAGQPDYLNAAVLLETDLTPHQLLDATQAIELAHGRVRKDERWGPRTLDLDIMLFGDMVISDARLTVPLGNRPTRIDCTRLYELEIARLRQQVELLSMAAE